MQISSLHLLTWPKSTISMNIDDPYYDMFAITRLLSNIKKENNCWIWTGYQMWKKYGTMRYRNKKWRVHRLSYLLIGKKSLTPGLVMDHLCRNRDCINPDHLEQVTIKENNHRGIRHESRNEIIPQVPIKLHTIIIEPKNLN